MRKFHSWTQCLMEIISIIMIIIINVVGRVCVHGTCCTHVLSEIKDYCQRFKSRGKSIIVVSVWKPNKRARADTREPRLIPSIEFLFFSFSLTLYFNSVVETSPENFKTELFCESFQMVESDEWKSGWMRNSYLRILFHFTQEIRNCFTLVLATSPLSRL